MPRKKPSETRQARQFALFLMGLLLVLACLWQFWSLKPTRAAVAAAGAAVVGLVAFAVLPLWLRIFRLWMKFGHVMGTVMSMVILTVFFYAFFTPISLVMRLLGRRPLDLAWKDGKTSYWIDKEQRPSTVEIYEKQF